MNVWHNTTINAPHMGHVWVTMEETTPGAPSCARAAQGRDFNIICREVEHITPPEPVYIEGFMGPPKIGAWLPCTSVSGSGAVLYTCW